MVKYSNGKIVVNGVLVMLPFEVSTEEINLVTLANLKSNEINFVQPMENHSVYSGWKEKISENQDGQILNNWCNDGTVHVHRFWDIYLHELEIQAGPIYVHPNWLSS